MKIKIDKERTWIFSPVNQIVLKVDIKGVLSEGQLSDAIRDTVHQYEMLHQKVVLDNAGNAYYEETELFEPVIEPMETDWRKVVHEQERIPFLIDQGEFIRFFYNNTDAGMTVLIIAHHIAGDGISFTYFVQDLMSSLSGEKVRYKKLEPFNMEKLPKEARLHAPVTWLMKYMNRKWKQTGRNFDFSDYYRMYNKYWNSRETLTYVYSIEDETYQSIQSFSKEKGLTINTMITTALIRASGELSDVGMAVSIREKGYTGMGNYATGISIKYQYDEQQSFASNAGKVQKLIYDKLNNASKKYFLLQFMRNIEPTLIDAVYFSACEGYDNKTAGIFSKMFGYDGNPKGISITNLTRLPIETHFKAHEIVDFVFVPPLVLNAERIIGAASFGNKMVLSLQVNNDEKAENYRMFIEQGLEYLKACRRN